MLSAASTFLAIYLEVRTECFVTTTMTLSMFTTSFDCPGYIILHFQSGKFKSSSSFSQVQEMYTACLGGVGGNERVVYYYNGGLKPVF